MAGPSNNREYAIEEIEEECANEERTFIIFV